MSTQQQRSELLTFGYVNKEYIRSIPVQLVKLIQLFYDKFLYFVLKDKQLANIQTIKSGMAIVHGRPFKIKGIEFEICLYPNGCGDQFNGIVQIGVRVKCVASNIEHFEYYFESQCELLNSVMKATVSNNGCIASIGRLLELKNMKFICFNCITNIKCIKYKKDCNKDDYYCQMKKMKKYCKFTWNINQLSMRKCKQMLVNQSMHSDDFDNGNWCLMVFPNGIKFNSLNEMQSFVCLKCFSFPHTIKSMDIKFEVVNSDNKTEINKRVNLKRGGHWAQTIIPLAEFKNKEILTLNATLEIINIYGTNDQLINENEWEQHGIIVNTYV